MTEPRVSLCVCVAARGTPRQLVWAIVRIPLSILTYQLGPQACCMVFTVYSFGNGQRAPERPQPAPSSRAQAYGTRKLATRARRVPQDAGAPRRHTHNHTLSDRAYTYALLTDPHPAPAAAPPAPPRCHRHRAPAAHRQHTARLTAPHVRLYHDTYHDPPHDAAAAVYFYTSRTPIIYTLLITHYRSQLHTTSDFGHV